MNLVCGIDEAGRGPLAGPVVAGAVVLNEGFPIELLNDSKKLSEKKRAMLEELIKKEAVAYGIALATHTEIDELNILQATLLAMKRAFVAMCNMLSQKGFASGAVYINGGCNELECHSEPSSGGRLSESDGQKQKKQDFLHITAIVDGTFCPDIPCACTAEPKADGKYAPVMAASILAKTERDRIMCDYARLYPEYGYEKHKGYPTKFHREVCRAIGMSPIQRTTFKF